MGEFIPGFQTRNHAKRAAERALARANGMPGKEGRHFHLVQLSNGRWSFSDGPEPKKSQEADHGR